MTTEVSMVHVGWRTTLKLPKGQHLSWLFILMFYCVPSSVDAACDAKFSVISGHSACLNTSADFVTGGVTVTDQNEIVDRHNTHRASVSPTATNMLQMSWDDEIAMVAQTYAENCMFEHDESYKRMIPGRYGAGQNLAVSSGTTTWTAMIDSWHSEVNNFTYGVAPAPGIVIGHYTQLVWAESHKIGCGYALCNNLTVFSSVYAAGHLYVCNYSPAGNIGPKQYPYISGPSCGNCSSTCSGSLCDCSAYHCYNYGTFDVDTCQCSCYNSLGFYAGDPCVLNCSAIFTPSACSSSFSPSDCPIYSNIPFWCPDDATCNFCPEADSTSLLTSGACDSSPCMHSGTCSNAGSGFTCNCTGTGYEGNMCQTDINECTTGTPCLNGGACSNTPAGSFTCNCTGTGYTGATCETDEDECATGTPCSNGGACSNTPPGSFTCDCTGTGYTGATCETDEDECATGTPCSNGGACSNTPPGSFTCDCTGTGYTGATCETDKDECATGTPCSNGGACSNTPPGSFTCDCTGTGYTGATCETDEDECATGTPCSNGGACSNTPPGSFTCDCTGTGYTGATCETDEDECATGTPCSNGGACSNTPPGSFTCDCTGTGYTGATCETDEDECATGTPCSNGGACSNTPPGSFTCDCTGTGYTGATCETDEDECATGTPCSNGGACSNTPPGSFTCDCTGTGYTGATCETDEDECATGTPCSNGGACSNTPPGSFTCDCTGTGYTGATCETDEDECATGTPCSNGGACSNTPPGSFTCDCTGTGYTGATCETDEDECATGTPCSNGGACSNTPPGSFTCDCTGTGYTGATCETGACDSSPCLHGTCSNIDGGFTCDCTGTGYTGDYCQTDVDECASGTPCSNGGTCTNTPAGSFTCDCAGTGYTGATCQTALGGALIQQGSCDTETGAITLNVTNAQGYSVYVSGCSSTDGESVASANEQVTITGCNAQLDTNYTIILAETAGVITGSDLATTYMLSCTRTTGFVNVTSSLTVRPGEASSAIVQSIRAPVMMMFTDAGSDRTGTPIATAALADPLRLHFWIDDNYVGGVNGFSIRVVSITLDVSGGPTIILTGNDGAGTQDGCMAKDYWGEMISVSPGYVMSEAINAFLVAGATDLDQYYSAIVEVCNGTGCVPFTCPMYSRKRRDLARDITEEVEITNRLRILPSRDTDVEVESVDLRQENEPTVYEGPDCEVCMEKGVLAGVVVFVVFVILLTNAASVYLFLRGRGRVGKGTATGPGSKK